MLCVINLLLLSFQLKDRQGVLYLERGINTVTLPFISASRTVARVTREILDTYVLNMHAEAENRELKQRMFRLQTQVVLQRNLASENHRLKDLLRLQYSLPSAGVAARVIGNTSFAGGGLILIDRGEDANIRKDMAVICPEGVVGRIWKVFPRHAQVQLISDPAATVAIAVGDGGPGGLLSGTGDPRTGEIRYVPNTADVVAGDLAVTTGADGIFPRGLPAARVTDSRTTPEFFRKITARFTVDLTNLPYVLVLPPAREERP